MRNKLKNLPIRVKMTGISLAVNMLVFMINIVLLVAMNNMSDKIDTVYQANLQLNEISASIKTVQDSMVEYLGTKTSDSLENYYRSAQEYSELTEALNSKITGSTLGRMERSIKNMSSLYLNCLFILRRHFFFLPLPFLLSSVKHVPLLFIFFLQYFCLIKN